MTLTLTSKRQATFPAQMCRELDLRPGDKLELDRTTLPDGQVAWVVHKVAEERPKWLGSLHAYAKGRAFPDRKEIEEAVATGIEEEWRAKERRMR